MEHHSKTLIPTVKDWTFKRHGHRDNEAIYCMIFFYKETTLHFSLWYSVEVIIGLWFVCAVFMTCICHPPYQTCKNPFRDHLMLLGLISRSLSFSVTYIRRLNIPFRMFSKGFVSWYLNMIQYQFWLRGWLNPGWLRRCSVDVILCKHVNK